MAKEVKEVKEVKKKEYKTDKDKESISVIQAILNGMK